MLGGWISGSTLVVVNWVAAFNAGLLTPPVEQLRTTGFEIDVDVSHLGPIRPRRSATARRGAP